MRSNFLRISFPTGDEILEVYVRRDIYKTPDFFSTLRILRSPILILTKINGWFDQGRGKNWSKKITSLARLIKRFNPGYASWKTERCLIQTAR